MIRINYVNPILNIGLSGWGEAWLYSGKYPEKPYTELYRDGLVFRLRGNNSRISYLRLQKDLMKKVIFFRKNRCLFKYGD
jgi:hypothetical protein